MPAAHSIIGGVGQGSTPDPHQLNGKPTAFPCGFSQFHFLTDHLDQPAKGRAGRGHLSVLLKHSLVGAIS